MNPYQSPTALDDAGPPSPRESFWYMELSWIISFPVTLFVTYAPVCAVIVYESDVFMPFTGYILLGYPCNFFTPVLIIAGTVFGRKNVAALVFTSTIILAITSLMAFVLYNLRNA